MADSRYYLVNVNDKRRYKEAREFVEDTYKQGYKNTCIVVMKPNNKAVGCITSYSNSTKIGDVLHIESGKQLDLVCRITKAKDMQCSINGLVHDYGQVLLLMFSWGEDMDKLYEFMLQELDKQHSMKVVNSDKNTDIQVSMSPFELYCLMHKYTKEKDEQIIFNYCGIKEFTCTESVKELLDTAVNK